MVVVETGGNEWKGAVHVYTGHVFKHLNCMCCGFTS